MRVPYDWLREFIPDLPGPERTAELLTGLGLAVETITEAPGVPAGVVAARIERVDEVPGSDHLLLATVRYGDGPEGAVTEVVSGAPNTRVGLVTALARPGVHLPALGLTVEERELAGATSRGVLCSPRELGVFDYAGGLIELPDDLPAGTDLAELWPGETVLELELTPNRADAFSLLGVARDLAAKLGTAFRHPAAGLDQGDPAGDDGLEVRVEDEAACPRLVLRRVDGVRIGPSPVWLQRRLAALGLRPRNNVVDVTNYVTFELGQPSHAYDSRSLAGGTLLVRRARQGETLVTLNEDELELDPADLVIATPSEGGSRPVGLAGVIGGLGDSVTSETTSVALEVAHFDPVTIRRAARRHALHTDAHYRFERGVDPNLPPLAAARAAQLIALTAGGTPSRARSEQGADAAARSIAYAPSRVQFLMDFHVPLPVQRRYLEALGCTVEERGADEWKVTVPSWRFDLAIPEDLVEEVARLHGYEHIGESVPAMHFVPPATDPTHRALRDLLAGVGFRETISYVFTGDAELSRARAPEPVVRLANPQGAQRGVLRTALYPGLLAAAALNRDAASLALFEVGRVFLEEETERVALLARGPWVEPGWRAGVPLDAFVFKGLIEKVAATLGAELRFTQTQAPWLHPGVAAEVGWNGRPVGLMGQLHPAVASVYELGEVFLAEFDLPLEGGRVRFTDLPRQPHAERDLAVIAPAGVAWAELREVVAGAAGELLESAVPFDVYTGDQVPEGHRSVALHLRFRHPERALRDAEVDVFMGNVISALTGAGYTVRDR